MNDSKQIEHKLITKISYIKKGFGFVYGKVDVCWRFVKDLSKRNKFILVSGGAVMVLVVVTVIYPSYPPTTISTGTYRNKMQRQKMAQLNHIESQLSILTSEISKSDDPSRQQVAAISARLNQIQNVVRNLATQSGVQEVKALVANGNNNLSGKVTNLLSLVKQIRKQITPIAYLKASVLPFKPISVDIWNGVPYVTVKLDGRAALIGKNETRGGWTVSKLDYDAQEAIFKNHKHQFVRVFIEN